MRIAICNEDNPANDLFVILMHRLCETLLSGIEFCFCNTKKEFLDEISEHSYDLVYLNLTGGIRETCTTLLELRELDQYVPVFLATEYWSYIEKLYDIEPITVIRKPFEKKVFRLFSADKKAEDITEDYFFEYFFRKKMYRVHIGEILYFESTGRNIVIHLSRGKNEHFVGCLDEVEKKLVDDGQVFVRSHQSYLIRRRVIQTYANDRLRLKNNEILPISRQRKSFFLDAMQ